MSDVGRRAGLADSVSGESMAMTKCIAVTAALVAIGVLSLGKTAQALEPTPMLDAEITTPAKNGGTQAAGVVVQSWAISAEQEIPLSGFYVAHLRSGAVAATIDGQTTERLPGDYWTVKASARMRVKAIGEIAVLETIVVTKK
jgi:quercetin dioxygenase-like cupin family protein